MIRICIFLCGLILFISCKNNDKIPPAVLKPEKMQAVLWDVIKADAFTTEFIKKDTAKNAALENLKLQQKIFAIHKITKVEFYNSYDYYKTNTAVFKIMLDSMIIEAGRNKNFNIKTLTSE
jgi:Domain of unknown function (DUF4296)